MSGGPVQERYHPFVVPVSTVITINSSQTGGFLCTTSGAITLTRVSDGLVLINAMPVVASTYYPLPFYIGHNGATFTAGVGAGLLGVA